MAFAPIFIVGVPRSGTTLLRVLLDSHSQILALPETPWMVGAYGRDASLREVLQGLIEGPFGAVRNISGVEPEHVLAAGRRFLDELFAPALKERNKRMLAFKTPADIRHLDFLTALFPDAFYIHITRDGRDVSMSQMAKRGSFFTDLKEYRQLSYANVFKRWVDWERRVRIVLRKENLRVIHLRYEDLIAAPARELHRVAEFLGVPFEPGMVDYAAKAHDYPVWEAGSNDVAAHSGLSADSVGKWRRTKLTAEMLYTLTRYDDALVELGYPPSRLSPSRVERTLAAGFPLIKPVLDLLSGAAVVWLRPLFKDMPRTLVVIGWLLLAVQFLAPAQSSFGLGLDTYQPALCFAASFGFGTVFGPALLRRPAGLHAFLYAMVLMASGLGLLEFAQEFAPGREPLPGDFLVNALAAVSATLVSMPFVQRSRTRLEPN